MTSTPRFLDPVRTPQRLLILGAISTLGLLTMVILLGWQEYQHASTTNQRLDRLRALQGQIVHVDEVLTMSTHMAAQTADTAWLTRYQEAEPQLSAALEEAQALAGSLALRDAVAATDQANAALVEMETRAFGLIRTGLADQARALLGSPAYLSHKAEYAAGMQALGLHLDQLIAAGIQDARLHWRQTIAAEVLIGLALLGLWLILHLRMRQWQRLLQDTHAQLLGSRQEVEALNRQLRSRVDQQQQQLDESERMLRNVINHAPLIIYALDAQGRFTLSEGQALETLGLKPGQVVGQSVFEAYKDVPGLTDCVRASLEGRPTSLRTQLADQHFDNQMLPLQGGGLLGVSLNVTHRVQSDRQIQTLTRAVEQNPTGILIIDTDGRVTYANPKAQRILGRRLEGSSWRELEHRLGIEADLEAIRDTLVHQQTWQGEMHLTSGQGAWLTVSASPLLDDAGALSAYLVSAEDISSQREAEQRAEHISNFDAVTSLPNRRHALVGIDLALERARKQCRPLLALQINLDGFKRINDAFGRIAGDELLMAVAARLMERAPKDRILARVGGDEFLLITPAGHPLDDGAKLGAELLAALAEPIQLSHGELVITASIGIACSAADLDSAEALARAADLAVQDAKHAGRNTVRSFDPASDTSASRQLHIEAGLRRALRDGGLYLLYQPVLRVADQALVGAEALMRWEDPTLGAVSPAEFIAVAERSDLIEALDFWALEQACAQIARWRDECGCELNMAVNCSARELARQDFPNRVMALLDRFKLHPSVLELEVTERVLIGNEEDVGRVLKTLSELGLRLSIDDFGTGYSSLSYLQRYPFDTLKIDRSFVSGLDRSPGNRELCTAIVGMARGLEMEIIAEGIETQPEYEVLQELGCDRMQGFLFGRPESVADFDQRIRKNSQSHCRP